MEAENFVVKGKFMVIRPENIETRKLLNKIKDIIIENLLSKGYIYKGPISFMYNYFELEFLFDQTLEMPLHYKLLKLLPIYDENKYKIECYLKDLERKREDIPWRIKIYLYLGEFRGKNGIILEIISEPAIFYQIVQLGRNPNISRNKYSYIIYTNSEFIEGVAKSIHAITIENPKPLSHYIKTNVSTKLKEFGFLEEAKLIEKGRSRIEIGDIENGLMDLRNAMERFFFNIIKKTGFEPAHKYKIKKNIEKLENLGYLSGEIKGFIIKMTDHLYSILSEQPAHEREPVKKQHNLFDARLFFDLIENIFDYLIEKIIRYNIRNHQKEHHHKKQKYDNIP